MSMKIPATRRAILDLAAAAVLHDRERDHGAPEDTFALHARLWNAYLSSKCGVEINLSPADVAAMLVLFKVGRIAANPAHGDSWADAAGYSACGGELAAAMVDVDATSRASPLDDHAFERPRPFDMGEHLTKWNASGDGDGGVDGAK